MAICPDTYAFLLAREYEQVRAWALDKATSKDLGAAKRLVLANADAVRAWVQHCEAHRKTLAEDSLKRDQIDRPIIDFADYLTQLDLTDKAHRKFKNN